MKEVEIELISKDTINPSSPTPKELIHYQIDQAAYPVYNPLVFFYSSDSRPDAVDITNLSSSLKISLSETLALFYPLAGRLRGNVSIDCNDRGCLYLETIVNSRLSDVVENQDLHELRKFVPFVPHDMGEFILGIQFNVFKCGGVAIGVCLSHKVGDAFSLHLFIKAWAAICHGEIAVPYPVFIRPSELFPHNINKVVPGYEEPQVESYVTKRFMFKSNTINTLKAEYLKARHRPLSRVEALTAFLWSRFAAATYQVHSSFPEKNFIVSNLVNLRSKLKPPLPDHCFGNLYGLEVTTLPPSVTTKDILDVIPKMRESTRKINEKDVHKHYLSSLENPQAAISLSFTSFCGLTLYDTDFGWGKPVWIGFPAWTFGNVVAFVDTKSRDGVEAYITLSKEDMEKFEKQIQVENSPPSDFRPILSRM